METTPQGRVLVLGLGNLLMGDEGVGVHAVRELALRSLPPHVDVMDAGTPGTDLVSLLDGYDQVFIVDAVDAGQEPGAVLRFTSEQVASAPGQFPMSLHQADVLEVLRLASFVGRPLPPVVIYGVQPAELGWSTELSTTVQGQLKTLLDALEEELANTTTDPSPDPQRTD